MAYEFPDEWHSLHRPINFALTNGPKFHSSIPFSDTGGLMTMTGFTTTYATLEGTKMVYVNSGTYQGIHTVKSIIDAGTSRTIITNTPYTGTSSVSQVEFLWPFKVRIHAGYPTVSPTDIIVNVFWNKDGEAVINVAPFLRELFTITTPGGAPDTGLFTHAKIEIVPGEIWQRYMDDFSETIFSMTGYDMDDHTLWVANGALPHDNLQNLASANAILTNAPVPVINTGINIFSIIRSTGTIDTVIAV